MQAHCLIARTMHPTTFIGTGLGLRHCVCGSLCAMRDRLVDPPLSRAVPVFAHIRALAFRAG
jgi:hypothetical protein